MIATDCNVSDHSYPQAPSSQPLHGTKALIERVEEDPYLWPTRPSSRQSKSSISLASWWLPLWSVPSLQMSSFLIPDFARSTSGSLRLHPVFINSFKGFFECIYIMGIADIHLYLDSTGCSDAVPDYHHPPALRRLPPPARRDILPFGKRRGYNRRGNMVTYTGGSGSWMCFRADGLPHAVSCGGGCPSIIPHFTGGWTTSDGLRFESARETVYEMGNQTKANRHLCRHRRTSSSWPQDST